MDESVLKTTRSTEQPVKLTTRYSVTHISPRPTPHSTSLPLYALHITPRLSSLPFTAFSWYSPHFKFPTLQFTSLHFTSLHLSLYNPCFWKYSISPYFKIPTLHFTSLHTFLPFSPYILGFSRTSKSLHFTSLITFNPLLFLQFS